MRAPKVGHYKTCAPKVELLDTFSYAEDTTRYLHLSEISQGTARRALLCKGYY